MMSKSEDNRYDWVGDWNLTIRNAIWLYTKVDESELWDTKNTVKAPILTRNPK